MKIEVTLSKKQFEALKKFRTISYYGGYELEYDVTPGYNYEVEVEKEIIKAFEKCAKGARSKKRKRS